MSDLTTFAEHARNMAEARHKPECVGPDFHDHWGVRRGMSPDPACPGCVTEADRALWVQIAGEIEAYLHTDEEATLL